MQVKNYDKKNKPAQVTVFVPVSRRTNLDRFLRNLKEIHFRVEPYFLFYQDTKDEVVEELLDKFCTYHTGHDSSVIKSGNTPPLETNIGVRRNRIVDLHEKAKPYIKGQWVFGLEDDTLCPPDTFEHLFDHCQQYEDIGFIEAVQVGRHHIKMVGAWRCDNLDNPTEQTTLSPNPGNIEKITGGGFYCYITPAHLFKEIKYRWHDECFGPDVCYVMDVAKLGYDTVIDWNISTVHMTEEFDITYEPSKVDCITYKKVDGFWQLQPYKKGQ